MSHAINRAEEMLDGAAARAIGAAVPGSGVVLAQEQFRTDQTLYTIEAQRGCKVRYSIKSSEQPGGLLSRAQMVAYLARELEAGRVVRPGRL